MKTRVYSTLFLIIGSLVGSLALGMDDAEAIQRTKEVLRKVGMVPLVEPTVYSRSNGVSLDCGNALVTFDFSDRLSMNSVTKHARAGSVKSAEELKALAISYAGMFITKPLVVLDYREATGDNGIELSRIRLMEDLGIESESTVSVSLTRNGALISLSNMVHENRTIGPISPSISVARARELGKGFLERAIDHSPNYQWYLDRRIDLLPDSNPQLKLVRPLVSSAQPNGFGIDGPNFNNTRELRLAYEFSLNDEAFACQFSIDANTGELLQAFADIVKNAGAPKEMRPPAGWKPTTRPKVSKWNWTWLVLPMGAFVVGVFAWKWKHRMAKA